MASRHSPFRLSTSRCRLVRSRTIGMYSKHYTIAWPHEEHNSGRPRLRSALYEHLEAAGACFGAKLGWERPNWFARNGERPADEYSFGRQNWFDAVGDEHRACRTGVVLFDQSSFAKFLVEGAGSEATLQWVCANDVGKPPGRLTYTQLLNDRGGIKCDLTVSRIGGDSFYIVTGTGFRTRDFHWISRQIAADADVELCDVTDNLAVLTLMGPESRLVLEQVTTADVSNAALPFGHCCDADHWRRVGAGRSG